ncbi:MAG: RloB domain-containing protein [Magnetococcales bacterium]|nr:RloB domain-containing protein [Magnetococcales bacterium]
MVVPRKERLSDSFERISNQGSPRDLTLLVCPVAYKDYFQGMVNHLELGSKVVVESINSEKAFNLQLKDIVETSLQAKTHRRLFALLDIYNSRNKEIDSASQILEAQKLVKIHNHSNNKIFRLLISNPSFFFWLLLHFKLVDYSALPESKWLHRMEEELEEFIPNFKSAKTQKEYFNLSYSHIDTAIKNSQRLQFLRTIRQTPSSDIHELVVYLLKLHRRYVS